MDEEEEKPVMDDAVGVVEEEPEAEATASEPTSTPTPPAPLPPKRRTQYSLEFKLQVARQYTPNTGGRTFDALARKHGLSKSNVTAWVAQRAQLEERLAAADRGGYRLDGCGRKSLHRELEDELERWLRAEAADGRHVRDADIQTHAKMLFHSAPAPSARAFKASSGWLARFKQRKQLIVRRTSRDADGNGGCSDGGDDGDGGCSDGGQALTDSGSDGACENGDDDDGADDDDDDDEAGGNGDEADERSVAWVERVGTALATRGSAKRGAPTAAGTALTSMIQPAPPTTADTPAPAAEAPAPAPPALPAPSADRLATPPSLAPVPHAAEVPASPIVPAPAPVSAPAPAPAPPALAAPAAAATPAPETSVVPAAWMSSIDRRLDELAQHVSHLVNDHRLLLGMLQRLVNPVAPSAAFAADGVRMHAPPPSATVAAAAPASSPAPSPAAAAEADATPRAKRRRVSSTSTAAP